MLYLYPTTLLLGLAGLVWLVLAYVRAHARLSHIPGPRLAGWSNFWLLRAQYGGRLSFILADVITKYGMSFNSTYCSALPA
jgi:hypothetical protein